MDTVVFERGDKVYLVGPVAPFEPGEKEIEEFAFAESLREKAPNKNLIWMRGQYVEADRPNLNGALWTADEVAIKSLTPMLMPVTVMHDPRTAVGLIADTKLLTPETASVERSRIDTTLGLWGHRFPDVVEEAIANYRSGTLMQSMECAKGYYDCGECGQRFPVLPGGAEEKNWCTHLRGETSAANGKPTRRLGNVTFTGTGLIFGTRGAKGAFEDAGLDVFQDEVAEFHERAHEAPRHRPRRKRTMDIEQKDYEALVAKAGRVDKLEQELADLKDVKETAAKVPELESKLEQSEIAKVAAEKERDDAKAKVTEHEEAASAATLASERMGKLGKGFVAKLGDVKDRLSEQAKSMSDEDWTARVEELANLTGVKSDEGGTETEADAGGGNGGDGTFTQDEVARSGAGGGTRPGNGEDPSPEARRSVVRGLVHPKPAAKS